MNVAAIMPCRGRAEQTVTNVRRLLATAGAVEWQLWCVVSANHDPGLAQRLHEAGAKVAFLPEFTYWKALAYVTNRIDADAPLLACLANDLLPGQHWLQRAVAAYHATFGKGDGMGMVGLNDGHHETEHSCHFLISRSLLDRYGGWPVWYQHNYGDTELCQRAIADGLYVKAPYATLFHDHVYFGGVDDEVYAEGRNSIARDHKLFSERKARGWPTIS